MTIHSHKKCDIYYTSDYIDTSLPENHNSKTTINGIVEAFEMTQDQYLPQFHLSAFPSGSTLPDGSIEDYFSIQLKNYDINGNNRAFMTRLFEYLSKGFKDITKIEEENFKENNLEVFV